jgi:hypothetical protein
MDDQESEERPRAYRSNDFPKLESRYVPDQADPLLVLAGDDAGSLRCIYEPYIQHWLPRVEAWASLGAQPAEVDALLGLKNGTMNKLMRIFPPLYSAWAYGFQIAKQQLLDSAFRRALKGDAKLTTFMLSAVYGVREKKEVDISQNITVTAEIGVNGEIGKKISVDDIQQAIDAEYIPLPPSAEEK